MEPTTEKLDDLVLLHGKHETRADGVCAMEAVAWLAGEPHSDAPQCTCPVIASFVRRWNDRIRDNERRTRVLRPMLTKMIGTRSTYEVEQRRAMLIMDWLIRENTPAWLELHESLRPLAAELRAAPQVTTWDDVIALRPRLQAVRSSAASVREAAWKNLPYADAAAAYAADARVYKAVSKKLQPLAEAQDQRAIELLERLIIVTDPKGGRG